jgi:hypothetical protein
LSQSSPVVDDTEFPPVVWRRSGRPLRTQFLRAYFVLATAGGALAFLAAPTSWIVAGVAVGLGLGLPWIVELYLTRWEGRVRAANKQQANAVLKQLRANVWIRNLAPRGWIALQEGILQMHRHDGRAAAKCFEQARRLAGRAPATSLISAEAHALVLAGDRKPARELLQTLGDHDALGDRDRLDLGLLLLQESGSNREALEQLERAHAGLGEHPRVLAGLALARGKVGAEDAAYTHFLAAEQALADADDPVAADVLKRARKLLRTRLKREQKQARSQAAGQGEAAREDVSIVAAAPASGTKNERRSKKNKKRDKKKHKKRDRRRDRKHGGRKHEERTAALAPPTPETATSPPPKAPLFSPSGTQKPAGSPLFAPPRVARPGPIPPPPVVPPPPKLGAPPKLGPPRRGEPSGPSKSISPPKLGAPRAPASSGPSPEADDDGWGDALGDAPSVPPVPPKK